MISGKTFSKRKAMAFEAILTSTCCLIADWLLLARPGSVLQLSENVVRKSKDRPAGILYKVKCHDFTYIGESAQILKRGEISYSKRLFLDSGTPLWTAKLLTNVKRSLALTCS